MSRCDDRESSMSLDIRFSLAANLRLLASALEYDEAMALFEYQYRQVSVRRVR